MSDKIKISWEDVHGSDVDEQLHQREAATRAHEHFQQQSPSTPKPQGGNFFYNTIVYMTIFGLLGGIVAWPLCEIVHQTLMPDDENWSEVQRVVDEVRDLEIQANLGYVSEGQFDDRIARLRRKHDDNQYIQILLDQDLSPRDKREAIDGYIRKQSFVGTLLFCAVAGLMIALFLSCAEPLVSRNWRSLIVNGSVGVCIGLLGGVLVGTFINTVYQALVGSGGSGFRQIFGRSIGWAILGLFLAVAPGIVMKCWKRLLIGLAGGFVGGLIGGALFDPVSRVLDVGWPSRAIGIVAIGLVAGAATGLIENVAKTGWLRVTGGLIAGKQFILYKSPTYIGSSPQCEIYLFKDVKIAPQHAAIRTVSGGYELSDLESETGTFVNGQRVTRTRLRHNDQVQIGSTTFVFQERGG